MKTKITLNDTIKLLNEANRIDPAGMHNLFNRRSKCNKKLSDHRTIQVQLNKKQPYVGPLGILNGLFGVDSDGYGPISMVVDKKKIVRFEKTRKVKP